MVLRIHAAFANGLGAASQRWRRQSLHQKSFAKWHHIALVPLAALRLQGRRCDEGALYRLQFSKWPVVLRGICQLQLQHSYDIWITQLAIEVINKGFDSFAQRVAAAEHPLLIVEPWCQAF